MKKYYYIGGQRVAMREGNTSGTAQQTFLLGDHLGSTIVTYRADTSQTSEKRYKPWGEVRDTDGDVPTCYTFTGQYSYTADAAETPTQGFGLMYYNARWYDLWRFDRKE